MSFTLKIKDKVEEREIDGDLTIKDLLDDLFRNHGKQKEW